MDDGGRKSQYTCQDGIKSSQFYFFIKKGNDGDGNHKNCTARVQAFRAEIHPVYDQAVEGGKSKFSQKNAVRVQMDIARVPCHEDDGDTEEQGKYEADSGIGGDEPALVEEFDQPHCKDTHEGRADNEEGRVQAADGKESEYDAEEDGMADGVSQHGHAPEDEEVPRQGTGG